MAIITVHSSLTVLSVACSIVIIAFAVVQGAGYAPTSHVILMAVGVLGCFSQGVLSYVANYGGVSVRLPPPRVGAGRVARRCMG